MKRRLSLLLALGLFSLASCPSLGKTPFLPPEGNRMQAGYAPTPFSAEQIRAKCEPGRTVVFEVETVGEPLIHQVFHFTKNAAGESVLQSWVEDSERNRIAEVSTMPAEWEVLQSHASFPEAQSSIGVFDVTVPLGTFSCWIFTVRAEEDGHKLVDRFSFAKVLPGPPILYEREVDGAILTSMRMIADVPE